MKYCFILLLSFLGYSQASYAVVFKVNAIPSYTPVTDALYIVGDFNNWNPADTVYKLEEIGNHFFVEVNSNSFEYKFTRGSFSAVEGNSNGTYIPNRTYTAGLGDTIEIDILSWEDLHGGNTGGTASDNVSIMDTDFYMPQLNRYRRIWIYLPPDYSSSNNNYPVVYMHDGQNLFDASTSFAGEWEVDETLDQMAAAGKEVPIVVGIDNGGSERINELSPWLNTSYNAGGEGDEYLDFIVNTLKPHIDQNYRTLTDREHTIIFGSSLGGLISMYALVRNHETFSKAGVFSPAYWFNQEIYDYTENNPLTNPFKVYQLAGGQEQGLEQSMNQMNGVLVANGASAEEVRNKLEVNGEHAEWFWRQEFKEAIEWLLSEESTSASTQLQKATTRLFPNPSSGKLHLETTPYDSLNLLIYNAQGSLVKELVWHKGKPIDVSDLSPGWYILQSEELKIKLEFTLVSK